MIDLQNIVLRYPNSAGSGFVDALCGVDLQVNAGEIFGIIGRSGAGKSSLVRCINLLNRPTSGRVLVNGTDLMQLSDLQLRAARRDIGMVFQHFNLLSNRSVFDNVALPLELIKMPRAEIKKRVNPLLELVGLTSLANRYPAQISGGQKQRVGIARALASQPKVLLSDEATSALDPETTRSILGLLGDINKEMGLTVVLITHQMQVVRQIATNVAVMDAGNVVERGSVIDIFTKPTHSMTKSLIDELIPQSLPASVYEDMKRLAAALDAGHKGRLVRLGYVGLQTEAPLLSHVIRNRGIDASILNGQVDDIQGQTFGSLVVYLSGENTALDAAFADFEAAGVTLQSL